MACDARCPTCGALCTQPPQHPTVAVVGDLSPLLPLAPMRLTAHLHQVAFYGAVVTHKW